MKRTLKPTLAALLAAVAGAAIAQAPMPQPSTAPDSAIAGENRPLFVDQPAASLATGAAGPNVQGAQTVADALNAEPTLKGSKLTVVPDEKGGLFITGVTGTAQQMAKAVTIATHHGGGGAVSSNISTEQVILDAGRTAADPALAMSAHEMQVGEQPQQQQAAEQQLQPQMAQADQGPAQQPGGPSAQMQR